MGCGSCGGTCGDGAEVPAVESAVVVAGEGEAGAVARDAAARERWPGLDARGLDQVKLAILWALLAGRPFRDELVLEFAPLDEVSADGPWVFRVPPALAALLAELDAARAGAVAAAWADADELAVDGWEAEGAGAVLGGLRDLARSAREAARPLLLRVSL